MQNFIIAVLAGLLGFGIFFCRRDRAYCIGALFVYLQGLRQRHPRNFQGAL